MKKKVVIVIGTRPNFIKITRFKSEASLNNKLDIKLIHTNQHFDESMSGIFFKQFGIEIDHFVPKFEGDPVSHFAHIVTHLGSYFTQEKPDLVMVVGDVNSTLAGAIVANKLGIQLAHLESGLRSSDLGMPEEINRILTDRITDMYFVTEESGERNLLEEHVSPSKIFFVGNTMIDTLVNYRTNIESASIISELELHDKKYALVTLHRPSNVDSKDSLLKIVDFLQSVSGVITIVFPMHHRTRKRIEMNGLTEAFESINNCIYCDALDYFSFQKLISKSEIVITDSGGIQEETTFLQIPCITLRENTERPVTVNIGSNVLMGFDADEIIRIIIERDYKKGQVPPLWDGNSTKRTIQILEDKLS